MLQKATTNTFSNGMQLDQNPMTMPNTALSGALNATLVTRDGNELILQLDKGNGRVETAYLPEGFVPIGTVEFGGIIYIASYNPLTNRSEIGCFPSPERNITSDELSECGNTINNDSFIDSDKEYTNSCLPTSYEDSMILEDDKQKMASIKNKSIKLKVLTGTDGEIYKLNPGDRYKIFVSNKVNTDEGEKNALEANAGTISDIYSDDDNVVDNTPRYLTIKMISLPEDGKIVYLDKNLKWDWDGNKYSYYISGDYEPNEDGTIDLDSYRSLVSSAYNVFNSKISGELGLLFDLKIVNSITITWDADIYEEDIALISKPLDELPDDSEYRWAIIRFYVNYESDSPRINLYRMIVTGSYLSVNGDRDEDNNGCPFGLALKFDKDTFDPATIDHLNENDDLYRKNDGTDEDLECDTRLFKYDISKLVDTIWNYELTPAMWFGNIDWLAIKGSINFKLLGSGVIDLIEWRYYVSATSLTLSWALEAYPEKNKKIFSVEMQFYDSDAIAEYYENGYTDNALEHIEFTDYLLIDDKKSYSGYFQNIFVFDDTDLERDKLYLVKLTVKYGAEADGSDEATDRIYLRWLYTTGQWNDEYLKSNGVLDFKELTLADVISFNASYDVTENISLKNTATELTNVSVPSLNDISSSDEYTMLGAVVTTVNYHYHPINPYFASDGKDFEVDISINSENSLFSTTTNEFKFELDNGNIINTASVLYDANESTYGEYVKPLIAEIIKDGDALVGMPEEAAKTVLDICTTHIENADYYKSAIDSFNALIQLDSSNKKHFDVKVLGMIYSKIDAEVSEETCTVGSVLRPMLYRRSDLASLNLHLNDDIEEGVIVKLKDDDSNCIAVDSPLVFNTFFLMLGENPGGTDNIIMTQKVTYDYEDNMPTTFSKVTMHKKDDWTLEKWSDGTDYSNKIALPFDDLGGPLLAVLYIGYITGESNSCISYCEEGHRISRTRNFDGHWSYIRMISFGLWMKNSTSSNWLPLNFFIPYTIYDFYSWIWYHDGSYNDSNRKRVFSLNCIPAGIIASIYNSIYKVDSDNHDQIVLETRTKNISWLGSLCEEIWQINVKCIATLHDDNISIGSFSLEDLKSNYYSIENSYGIDSLSNNAADIANITFSKDGQDNEIGTCQLSHRFTISNNNLFLKYKDLESTSLPYGAYYENDTTLHIIDNINADYYVYVDGELKPLDNDTALHICLTKELTINKVDDVSLNDIILCDLNSGRYHLLGDCDGAKLFADLGYDNGKPCFGKAINNMGLTPIYFLSKDKSKDTGTINDCSNVKFGVNYINDDGTFDMTLGGGELEDLW